MAEIQPPNGEPASGKASTPPITNPVQPRPNQQRGPSLNQIYALPAPIRTFPLPTFYPNNPISLFHVVYAWLGQVFRRPSAEPAVIHSGIWSAETSSVHVTDEKSMRALWEQGFYGKGSLSRSEPNWLKREKVRRGQQEAHVSEILTVQRREERARTKWERARLEQEAIRQTRLEEAQEAKARLDAAVATSNQSIHPPSDTVNVSSSEIDENISKDAQLLALESKDLPNGKPVSNGETVLPLATPIPVFCPPVNPLALLALPNSFVGQTSSQPLLVKEKEVLGVIEVAGPSSALSGYLAPVTPAGLLSLPNSDSALLNGHIERTSKGENTETILKPVPSKLDNLVEIDTKLINGSHTSKDQMQVSAQGNEQDAMGLTNSDADTNGHLINGENTSTSSEPSSDGSEEVKPSRRRKSVRFSPKVESTTFERFDPPSPNHAMFKSKLERDADLNGKQVEPGKGIGPPLLPASSSAMVPDLSAIVNKEHLQLMPEEAFFLSFGLGALSVKDPTTGRPLTTTELFTRFRQYSYFPPRIGPEEPELQPDDGFLVHYCVYHHFRSLGWVPRGGIKFGVDWLLYTRGPVFDHAEFGLIVIPSYSDSAWKDSGKKKSQKTWQWLHGTVRVLSHVTKSLVLVYVDVPSPAKFEQALEKGIADVFKLYKVREVMVKRWSSNRNR